MDRADLKKAKENLLCELLRIPDDEKTTSDVELEAELMNDWEITVLFESAGQKMVKNGVSCDTAEKSQEAVNGDDT